MNWKITTNIEDGAKGIELMPKIVLSFNKILADSSIKEFISLTSGISEALSRVETTYLIEKTVAGTVVTLIPKTRLLPNQRHAILISKWLKENSIEVTDGDFLFSEGTYTGPLSEDSYEIEIIEGGKDGTATYKWKRLSDNLQEGPFRTVRRFIEIDRGVQIKFDARTYSSGTKAQLHARNVAPMGEMFMCSFSTGESITLTPIPESSKPIISFPTEDGVSSTNVGLKSSSIQDRAVLVPLEENEIVLQFDQNIASIDPLELKKKIRIKSESLEDLEIKDIDFTVVVEEDKIRITLI